MHDVVCLLPAGGSGARFGGPDPKQFLHLRGVPVVLQAVGRLRAAGLSRFVVALPSGHLEATRADPRYHDLQLVAGGDTRQASVQRCLAEARALEWVLVHDAARAAVDPVDVRATVEAARDADGAILGRRVTDTLKRLKEASVVSTVDRDGLFRAETPQVFRRRVLLEGFRAAQADRFVGTDEASLVERLPGVRIVAVEAARPNPKLTLPADLEELEALLAPSTGVRA